MTHHVLVLEPLSSGGRIPAAVRALGGRVSAMALDSGTVRLDDNCRTHLDRLVRINLSDEEATSRAVDDLHAADPITAVVPGFEYFVPLAHRLAARLGLLHNDLRQLDATRLKHLMARRAQECGVPIPRTHVVDDRRQALAAAEDVGFPSVVKAPDSTASCDVYRVEDEAQLLDRCGTIWRRPPEDDWLYPVASFALIQEFVAGPEYSVDTVSFGTGPALVNITEKLVTNGPQFVELGHAVPAAMSAPDEVAIRQFAAAVHEAYGIRVGAAHIELRMRAGQPVLIEVAARLAGDRITELVELATGVDMCRETVRSFLGATAAQGPLTYQAGACVRFVTVPAAGRFHLDDTAVRRSPHLHSLDLPAEVDASGLLRDYRDRHGNLMVRASTAAEAVRRADELLRLVTFTPLAATGRAS